MSEDNTGKGTNIDQYVFATTSDGQGVITA